MKLALERKILDFAPLVGKYTWNKPEDVKAEAWLAVIEAIDSYDVTREVPFAGYIESRVKYCVWNLLKRKQRQELHEISIASEFKNGKNSLIEILPNGTDISQEVEDLFLSGEIRKAIHMLPVRQRIVIIKTMFLGFKLVDIATELEVAPQAIFNLRKRALARLKRILEKVHVVER